MGVITMLPALSPIQTVSLSDGQQVRQPGFAHPVAQVEDVAAGDEQGVRFLNQRHPPFPVDAGQRCQLQHADGLPAQVDHGVLGVAADELPSLLARADHGMPVLRSRDAQRGGLSDRLAKKSDERVADAGVGHTP
jgi:hypothetical protein